MNNNNNPAAAPRVLQVVPALDQGGVEVGTLEMARYLVAQGWGSWVVSNGGRMVGRLAADGSTHLALPLHKRNPWQLLKNGIALARLVKQHKISLLHARSRGPAWSAWVASRLTGVPYVTTYHGIYGHEYWLKRVYNSAMLRGKKVIANSRYTLAHLENTYDIPPQRLALAIRGYDETLFEPTRVDPDAVKKFRHDWGAGQYTPVILLVGRLTRLKGHAVVLEALAQLLSQKWQAVFVGSGTPEFTTELQTLTAKYGLTERVHFAGGKPETDMPACLMAADLCLSASVQPESFGRTIIEAQAMGTPVIATNHGGALELVDRNITGWLVPPGNANALAQAIKKALQLPLNDRKNMTAACRAWASQFTTAKMCAAELAVYQDVLGRTSCAE